MQKHEDNLASRINGNNLQPLSGVTVTVTNDATGLPASLYSDNGVTLITAPIVTSDTGGYSFYAADGKYTITYSSSRLSAATTRKLILEDPDDNPSASLAQLAAAGGSSLITFMGAGTGSVAGTQQDRGRLVVHLWDYLSSAQRTDVLGRTGSVDCTAAFQAAVDYAATLYGISGGYGRGGAIVELPYGAVSFTTLTRKNGVSIRGQGRYKSLLLMSQSGGTGFKCAAATSQLAADNVYWMDDADYSLIPNPATTFSAATILWNMIGFSRITLTNVAFSFKANITAISVKNATTAGTGGPSQWYNSFYDVFVEGEASGGIGWDLGDTAAAKEQITTWNWYGGRTSGNAAVGTGMKLNSATGCNLYGHVFEGLADELIIGSAAGPRVCQQVGLYGCYFEGSANGYTIYSTANSTVIVGGFSTGVTNTDNGTRTTIIGDGVTKMPVANSANSFQLAQASSTNMPQVIGSTLPGVQLTNTAGNWVKVANNANSSSALSFLHITDNIGHDLLQIGSAKAQIYPSQFSIGNQSLVSIFTGAGTPEAVISASPGSLYMRTNGGALTSLYVKETGTGNTGWVGK